MASSIHPSTFFVKSSILDDCQDSKYAPDKNKFLAVFLSTLIFEQIMKFHFSQRQLLTHSFQMHPFYPP